jgi:probable phosphoglycerate mutase
MNLTRILAIRHGETTWNVDTRIQGQMDIPLNDHGRWQAQQLAKALADEEIHAVYASDLSRAYETAQAVASSKHIAVQARPQLRERHFGDFQGHTWQDIQNQWPQDAEQWRVRHPDWTPQGGGESLVMLHHRIEQLVDDIASPHAGQQVLWVTHGGVLDILYRMATGQDLQAARTWGLRNTAINRLLWTPQGLQLVGWADEDHLEAAKDESSA